MKNRLTLLFFLDLNQHRIFQTISFENIYNNHEKNVLFFEFLQKINIIREKDSL